MGNNGIETVTNATWLRVTPGPSGNLNVAAPVPSAITRQSERGFGIIETLVATLLITLAFMAAAQHMAVSGTLLVVNSRQRMAEVQAISAISKVASLRVPDHSGSFINNADGTIGLGSLQLPYYDYVVIPDPLAPSPPPLPTGCGAWPCAVDPPQPSGTKILFVRVWNTFSLDAARGLHQARVAVFPGEVLTNPSITALTYRRTRMAYH